MLHITAKAQVTFVARESDIGTKISLKSSVAQWYSTQLDFDVPLVRVSSEALCFDIEQNILNHPLLCLVLVQHRKHD